jgi:hypothetical protein
VEFSAAAERDNQISTTSWLRWEIDVSRKGRKGRNQIDYDYDDEDEDEAGGSSRVSLGQADLRAGLDDVVLAFGGGAFDVLG